MSRVGSRDAWTKKRKLTSSADADAGNVKKVLNKLTSESKRDLGIVAYDVDEEVCMSVY